MLTTKGVGTFANFGFLLEEGDDHLAALLHEDERIAYFSQTGPTEENIQAECAKHLINKHGWDGSALWQPK